MRYDYWRHLRDYAEKYDLELLHVSPVRNESDVAIAEIAIMQLDDELTRAGDRWGMTIAMPYDITVQARRTDKAWKRINRTH